MAETETLTSQESAEILGTAEKLYASLEKEFPGILKNRFDIHVIGAGEDAAAWNLIGLKPGPAFVVEVSAGTAFGDLPESSCEENTPLKHGFTVILQPDKNGFSMFPLVGTLGTAWNELDDKSDENNEVTVLSRYYAALRKSGRWYEQPKTIKGWARFGKEADALNAFEQRMIKHVIYTPEMEEVFGLTIQKLKGTEHVAVINLEGFRKAFQARDVSGVADSINQLITMEPLYERLMKSLDKVAELQKETVDTFENHSSWSLRAPKEIVISPSLKKVLKVTGAVAGGAIAIGGGSISQTEAANPVVHEPVPIAAPAPSSVSEFATQSEDLWADTQQSRSPKGISSVRDLLVALKLPTQSESVLTLNQSDMRALQEGGIQKLAEQWAQSLPDELHQKIDAIAARLEAQAVSMQDAVVEAGQALAAEPKALVWLAGVVEVVAVGNFIKKHPKEFFYTVLSLGFITSCIGVGEIPTPAPTAAGEVQLSVEEAKTTIIVTDENGNDYSVNEGRTFTSEPYYGYLINYETNTGTETVNRFQFARADVQNTKDPSKTDFVTLFQQVDAYGNPTAELFLVETNTPGVYELIDQNNNHPGYSIIIEGDRVIFRVEEDGIVSDFLISKKLTPSADGSTPVATQSPEDLRTDINGSHKVQMISLRDDAAIISVTDTPEPTDVPKTPTPVDPDRPADAIGDRDPETGYYTKKAEDGVHLLYWSPEVNGWTELHTPEDIYLIDKDTTEYSTWFDMEDLIQFSLFVDPSFKWTNDLIRNPDEEAFYKTHESRIKLTSFSTGLIVSRVSQQGLDKEPDYSIYTVNAMLQKLANGETVDFITKDGTQQHWDVRKGVEVYFIPKGTLHGDTDPLVYNTEQSQWKVYTVNKKLIVIREVFDPANDKIGGNDMTANLFAALAHVWVDKDGIMPENIRTNGRNAEGITVSVIFGSADPKTTRVGPVESFLTTQPR